MVMHSRSQPSIPMGEQFGLLTRIAATESVTLRVRDEKLTAFIELEAAIRCPIFASVDRGEGAAFVALPFADHEQLC